MKYAFLLILIVLAEIALILAMFVFVSLAKLPFVIASLALIVGAFAYLIVSRHKEKTKVKPKFEVWNGYFKVFYVIFIIFISVLAGVIVIRGLVFLIARV